LTTADTVATKNPRFGAVTHQWCGVNPDGKGFRGRIFCHVPYRTEHSLWARHIHPVMACPIFQLSNSEGTTMNMRIVLTCLLSLILVSMTPLAVQADMLSTSMMLDEVERSERVEMVENYMSREDVRSQMEAMGVDPALAVERVAGLTDSQLEKLALSIESEPAGGSDLGIVIAVLVILILLEILGVTNLFGN
jgi:hypothetical protein